MTKPRDETPAAEPTLLLHIGPPKTGSTSIQSLLHAAKDELLAKGVLYPVAGRGDGKTYWVRRPEGRVRLSPPVNNHQLAAWALLGEVEEFDSSACWREVVAETETYPAPYVTLSAEAFARLPEAAIARIRDWFPRRVVKALLYYRSPLPRLLSAYTQDVKMGRCHRAFGRWIDERADSINPYGDILSRFGAVLGRENLIVASFDGAKGEQGIAADYLAALGIDQLESVNHGAGKRNRSPAPEIVRALRLVNWIEKSCGPLAGRRAFGALRRGLHDLRLSSAVVPRALRQPLASDEDRRKIESLASETFASLTGEEARGAQPEQNAATSQRE